MTSWEEKVRRVVPYVAGEQPKDKNIIKLNTNECPYPPAAGVQEALRQLTEEYSALRLYPDMDATPLVDALARKYELDPDQIFVGVGSDDVLALCFLTFFTSGGKILFPTITYSFYDVWADLFHIPYEQKPLDAAMNLVPADYIPVGDSDIAGIIFPNPNAPTGVLESLDTIEEIVRANPDSIIIIDEAYIDFGGESCIPLIHKYDNLLVTQTFSKSRSLAGGRLGFGVGAASLIQDLNTLKYSTNPYNVNRMTAACGVAAIRDSVYYQTNAAAIQANRAYTALSLRQRGFTVTESMANFLFIRPPKGSGEALYRGLKARGVLIRHWQKARIRDWCRVTIGTKAQMDKFLEVILLNLGIKIKQQMSLILFLFYLILIIRKNIVFQIIEG